MNIGNAFANGFLSGAVLIIAIGAQNAFVLRQGLRCEHVTGVVLVCALSDALLIQAGVWGFGVAVAANPVWANVARWAGATFLVGYGLRAAARALQPASLEAGDADASTNARAAIMTALALTWLNPHVYLDTVLLLGAIASPYDKIPRTAFAAGATLASLLWFSGLGYGARWLAPVFANPMAWRALDGLIALIMVGIALGLVGPRLH